MEVTHELYNEYLKYGKTIAIRHFKILPYFYDMYYEDIVIHSFTKAVMCFDDEKDTKFKSYFTTILKRDISHFINRNKNKINKYYNENDYNTNKGIPQDYNSKFSTSDNLDFVETKLCINDFINTLKCCDDTKKSVYDYLVCKVLLDERIDTEKYNVSRQQLHRYYLRFLKFMKGSKKDD